jgi:hypothetical protein
MPNIVEEDPVPPEAPLSHIYTTTVHRDNRWYEVHERVTTFGVAPRTFDRFMARLELPTPTRFPNGQTGYTPKTFFCPLKVETVIEGFTRFRELVEPQFKVYHDQCVAKLAEPQIQTATRMPGKRLGG